MKNDFLYDSSVGLFLMRLGLAAVFIIYGWMKLANIKGTTLFFDKLGLPLPFVYLVPLVEILGGVSMLLGFWTRLSGLLLAIDMFCVIYLVKFHLGFAGNGYGFELMLLLASLGIFFTGPGKYSLSARRNILT